MCQSRAAITVDALRRRGQLPADILADLPTLIVDRQGTDEQAFMRTEDIIGHAAAHRSYRVTWEGLLPAADDLGDEAPAVAAVVPPHAVAHGVWDEAVDLRTLDANILGGMGSFRLPAGQDTLTIPVSLATPETVAFYGSRLLAIGQTVRFGAPGNLPVTITAVGATYVEHYLMKADKGGGTYLEHHDRPHFHMPLNQDARGHLIMGKPGGDGEYLLSAFRIPFGSAIAMAPHVLHNDAYLVGRYMVIYATTDDFSTVIVRRADGALAGIGFDDRGGLSLPAVNLLS